MTALIAGLAYIIIPNDLRAGEPAEPTLQEREFFAAELELLLKHKDDFPHSVEDVIRTLTDTVVIEFHCPPHFRVESVDLRIITKQITWDPLLVINDEEIRTPPTAAGFYVWHPRITVRNNKKTVVADNMVMLNTEEIDRNKLPLPFDEVSVLYHEFLHGQLQIDAMRTKVWMSESCVCHFNSDPQDGQHLKIPEYVHRYLGNLAKKHPDVYTIEIPAQPENYANGLFRIPFADVQSLSKNSSWETIYYYPERSNVQPNHFEVTIQDDKVVAHGFLIERKQKGFMLVHLKRRP